MPSIYEKLSIRPVPYDPAFEIEEENEKETAEGIVAEMRRIIEITEKDYGRGVRTVHAKAHGILTGRLDVLPGLPKELAQGAFAEPKSYPAVLRFSTNPGDILDDAVSVPRGLAMKIVGVEGERLPGSEGDVTQDFVTANGPAFVAPTAAAFLQSLKLLSRTTDTPQALKKGLSAVLRGVGAAVEAAGGDATPLKALGGHPATHILGETFFSQAPLLFGPYMGKIRIAPVTERLKALKDQPVQVAGRPDALREEVAKIFSEGGGEWELSVQLLTDPETMPIEDASVVWPEDKSPYVPVARIVVGRQTSWGEKRTERLDEELAFAPWHGLAAHRPLGSVMRVRKPAYEMSSTERRRFNGCPMHEPASAAEIDAPKAEERAA
ncbi:catalase family protein [Aureimonas mangrovi]|uniref:catalase family protein n=1 Tax=Aureimonas mangrovi TaxID=2758041 RepID=UPI00163DB4A7|nr:catalase family protein [Aureimonas mangrovi]